MTTEAGIAADPQVLSELIGAIYDCAIDPNLWPHAIELICKPLGCGGGLIALMHREPDRFIVTKSWNMEPEWLAKGQALSELINSFWFSVRHLHAEMLETPISALRLFGPEAFYGTPWVQEMLVPYGICDSIDFLLIGEAKRGAELGLARHIDAGPATDEALALAKLLNPHIRRAILISDVLNASEMRAQMLDQTLDALAAGVVVVSPSARILHANRAAREMLDCGGPIISRGGQLGSTDNDAATELRAAIGLASDERRIGATGSGTPIMGNTPAVAHVLPLRQGRRANLVPSEAAAAVFISHATAPPAIDTGAMARLYGLTPAETRMLEALLSGDGLAEIARRLAISEATARTHRSHIFAKTGVARRAELTALAWRLASSLAAGW